MTPQLKKIAECLSESNAREIKLARCLAESLKRIQSLETSGGKQAKVIEKQFNQALRGVAEALAKEGSETAGALSQRIDGIAQALPVELSAVRSEMETVREMAAKTTGAANIAAAEIAQRMTEIEANFPAQIAALKTEFATPAAQAAAPQSFNPRGAYEPGEKYKPFDYVSSNGSSYIALVENPTQPPSKKSKQWMLVAARGAGGGGVTGLGTAAYRDVGQAAGNVLELSASGIVSLVGLEIYDTGNEGYASIRLYSDLWTLGTTTSAGISFGTSSDYNLLINGTNISGNRTYTLPDVSGTIALLSQVGDRYLTSSTTSNTISNGAKTFTVGTGLAYSPTQDVTIVFNASNHMHGSVTSYDSVNGVLVVDVNHNTGSGTYAVWTVNVGGIGAGAIPSGGTTGQVLAKLSNTNYDDAWVTPTAATTTTAGTVPGVGIALPQAPVGTNAAYISQLGAIGRNFSSFLYTDFLSGGFSGAPASAGDGFIFGTGASGTGASVSKLNINVSGRAGILLLTTGTTATGYAAIDTWANGNTYRYDDGETVFESLIRLPVLSDATNEYVVSIGGGPQNNGVIGNDGAFFTYNRASFGANWQAASKRNGSQTTTNSNVAVVANAWFRLAFIVNATGTSITYYIDGVLVATITTNIQTGGVSRDGCLLVKTAGTTSVTANIDYYFLGKTFTTAR